MKISIIAMEIPYPPIHGGRADIWRRIKALSDLGTDLQLLCWCPKVCKPEDLAMIKKYVKNFYPIYYDRKIAAKIRRFIHLFSYPLEVTSRILQEKQWEEILSVVGSFEPDVILSDHVHCGVVALPLSQKLNIPMIVRSHDIEHLHYGYLLKSAKGYRKILRLLSLNHLEGYEKSMFKQSLAFYDISADDLNFWKNEGFTNGYFLPPLIESFDQKSDAVDDVSVKTKVDYDLVFLGNLRTENNMAGIAWLIQEVLPLLKVHLPEIKVLIAGSNPTYRIQKLVEKSDGVDLKINPVSAMDIYQSGHILVNPVATGSGVSIKSIDMLTAGKPIVTLPKGLYGLPEEAKQFFRVAVDANSFAVEVLNCLNEKHSKVPDRDVLNSLFGYSVIENFLSDLNRKITGTSLSSNL